MAESADLILNVIEKTTGSALREGARDLDRTADSADNASGSFRALGKDSGFVDSEIVRLRSHIRDLGTEIDRTGNTSLLKDVGKDQSALRRFESIAKKLGPLGQEAGNSFSKGFLSSLGELGSNLRGALIPAAIGAVALLSPIIGASIAGAVVGTVGLGGIAGGIAAAAQDPKVRAAASVFGSEISREFAASGSTFVQPVISSLQILKQGFSDLHLETAFAKVAPFVEGLARGISGLATSAMPGLNRALDAAGPAIQLLANELPQVGAAFGDMIGDIAESKGAIEGLHFVLEAIEGAFRVTGTTVAWLSDRFHELVGVNAQLTGDFEDIFAKLAFVSPAFALLSGKTSELNDHLEELRGTVDLSQSGLTTQAGLLNATSTASSTAIGTTAGLKMAQDAAALSAKAQSDALRDLKTTLDAAFNAEMSLDQATLAIKTDTLALKEAVAAHGASLSNNTQVGLQNQAMILGLVADYERQREASSTSAEATAAATAKFNAQVGQLRALAEKLGFSKSQVDALIGSYQNLLKQPNITKTITYKFVTVGRPPSVAPQIGGQFVASAFADGGWVGGAQGAPQLAIVHGGEFVVSHDMMRGKTSGPARNAPAVSPGPTSIVMSAAPGARDAVVDFIGEMVQRFVYLRGGNADAVLSNG